MLTSNELERACRPLSETLLQEWARLSCYRGVVDSCCLGKKVCFVTDPEFLFLTDLHLLHEDVRVDSTDAHELQLLFFIKLDTYGLLEVVHHICNVDWQF